MSKTDAHRPFEFIDPELLTAHHDHSKSECTLPEERKVSVGARKANSCYWQPSQHQWGQIGNICGCPMCTEKFERREARRKVRHNSNKVIAESLREMLEDTDYFDPTYTGGYDCEDGFENAG